MNGDGFDDVIVGDSGYSNGETSEGAAFVYLGSSGGLAATPVWSPEGNEVDLFFGSSVAGAGDVNGDGFDDLLVSTYQFDGGLTDIGKAWLYLGSASGPSPTPAWSAVGDSDRAWFGWKVAAAGDVDGDSYADVAISAIGYPGVGGIGRAYLYRGTPTGLELTPAWDTGYTGGSTVGIGGDMNGDGLGDVLVGVQDLAADVFLCHGGGPVADAGPDQRVQVHHRVTFDASGTQGGTPPLAYSWDLDGDGIPDASGPIVMFTYSAQGPYTVTLTVTDALHCSDTDSLTVTTSGKHR